MKDLELVHIHYLANPYTDLTNSLQGTKYFCRKTNTVFGDTGNSLSPEKKYFLWEICVFRDTNNSLRGTSCVSFETQLILFEEPLEKQMI